MTDLTGGRRQVGSTVPEVRTLGDYYGLMEATAWVRRRLVACRLEGRRAEPGDLDTLQDQARTVHSLCGRGVSARLQVGDGVEAEFDLSYELTEIDRDLLFLRRGADALTDHLAHGDPAFESQRAACREAITAARPLALVSDRDGTLNNYCARYGSSVQPAWNAVFLCRYARACVRHTILLTSAPLLDGGVVDMSVMPPGSVTYAGSKGREYLAADGRRGALPVEREQQDVLDRLNDGLEQLLQRPENRIFRLIGSGYQRKHGQSTVARQDIHGHIPAERSERFRAAVAALVAEVDPSGTHLRIEDTGTDIEILLTVAERRGAVRDFDKGDGVRFLERSLALGIAGGRVLVCGDTRSDIPLYTACRELARDTHAVFVTRDEGLKAEVRATCGRRVAFVDRPDTLVAALHDCSAAAQGRKGP